MGRPGFGLPELQSLDLKLAATERSRGTSGFGWNRAFIQAGQSQTLGEMPGQHFISKHYAQVKPLENVGNFIRSLG